MKKTIFVKISLLLALFFSMTVHSQTSSPDPLANAVPHFMPVPHGKIEYYKFGSGSPIILISGYAVNVSSWDSRFLAALAKEHTVIIFDNRNVGGTYIHSGNYRSKDLANDLFALTQKLKLQKINVLGFSMGGMIAQQFAVLHPQAVENLILLNTAIAGNASVAPNPNVKNILFQLPQNKLVRYAKTLSLFFPGGNQIPMALNVINYHFKPTHYLEKEITPEVLKQQQNLLLNWQHDDATKAQIEKLNLPVLVLNGGADAVIPPANSDVLSKEIPHAKLLRWDGGGHAMIYQYPYELAGVIDGFIAKD